MRKFLSIFAAVALGLGLTSLPGQATTYQFGTYFLTQSGAFGTGSFGSVTVSDLGGSIAKIDVEVAPNFLLDTGGHFAFALSLNGTGHVDPTSFNSGHFSLVSGSSFMNSPFGNFNTAIQANCTQGNCGPTLGSSLVFNVLDFAGVNTATDLYNGLGILFAADIYKGGCTGSNCTGVVGASASAAPGPIAGAGLPGLIAACSTLIALARRRRTRMAA